MCFFKVADWRNFISHTSHSYGFSFVWIRMWLCKWPSWRKASSQTSHSYGFSFVWIRMCVFKLLDWVKRFSHTSHSYGLSFVWIRMCRSKFDRLSNTFPQTSHSCCVLFLFAPFLLKVVSSFCIWWWFTSRSSSSSSGILEHNTKFGSSFSRAFKTVLAFTALFGCGFFLLRLMIKVVLCVSRGERRREVLSLAKYLVFTWARHYGKKKIETFLKKRLAPDDWLKFCLFSQNTHVRERRKKKRERRNLSIKIHHFCLLRWLPT